MPTDDFKSVLAVLSKSVEKGFGVHASFFQVQDVLEKYQGNPNFKFGKCAPYFLKLYEVWQDNLTIGGSMKEKMEYIAEMLCAGGTPVIEIGPNKKVTVSDAGEHKPIGSTTLRSHWFAGLVIGMITLVMTLFLPA
jgi:hypothetical protein